jgi:hypothetical protein
MQAATTRVALLTTTVAMALALAGGSWYVGVYSGCRSVLQLRRSDPAAVTSLKLTTVASLCERLGYTAGR